MATSCPLGQECPLARQKNPLGVCPLKKDCRKFPTGRLKGQLGDLNSYLGASINSFSDNQDLLQALNQLQADISVALSKLD